MCSKFFLIFPFDFPDYLTNIPEQVEYYGTPVSLKSIAQISTPDASSILISPFDKSRYRCHFLLYVNKGLGVAEMNTGKSSHIV